MAHLCVFARLHSLCVQTLFEHTLNFLIQVLVQSYGCSWICGNRTHTHMGVHTHHIHTQTDTQREELGFILKALAAINF